MYTTPRLARWWRVNRVAVLTLAMVISSATVSILIIRSLLQMVLS